MRISVGPNAEGYVPSGPRDTDAAHRQQSKTHGVFPSIWPDTPQHLSDDYRRALISLRVEEIERGKRKFCIQWWRIMGCKPDARARIATLRNQIKSWRKEAIELQRACKPGLVTTIGTTPPHRTTHTPHHTTHTHTPHRTTHTHTPHHTTHHHIVPHTTTSYHNIINTRLWEVTLAAHERSDRPY